MIPRGVLVRPGDPGPIEVCEPQLRPGMRAVLTQEHPGPRRPRTSLMSVISDTHAPSRQSAARSAGLGATLLGDQVHDLANPGIDRDFEGELDSPFHARVSEQVSCPGGVRPGQHPRRVLIPGTGPEPCG